MGSQVFRPMRSLVEPNHPLRPKGACNVRMNRKSCAQQQAFTKNPSIVHITRKSRGTGRAKVTLSALELAGRPQRQSSQASCMYHPYCTHDLSAETTEDTKNRERKRQARQTIRKPERKNAAPKDGVINQLVGLTGFELAASASRIPLPVGLVWFGI